MRYTYLITGLMIASLAVVSNTHAQEYTHKTRDILLRDTPSTQAMLEVNIRTSQSLYKVDEPIFLQAEGNQDFYLYVFSTGRDGTTTMLIPNAQYTNNFFKAKTTHTIPDGVGPSLVGDQPGKETLMIVASATPMTFDKGFTPKGPYRQAKTKDVKRMFRSKDIKWVERVSPYAATVSVSNQTVSATVASTVGSTPSPATASASPSVANTTDTASGTTTSITTTSGTDNNTSMASSSSANIPAISTTTSPASTTDITISDSAANAAGTTNQVSSSVVATSLDNSVSTVSTIGAAQSHSSAAVVDTTTISSPSITEASTGQVTNSNQTSIISAPSLSDNKKTVSYLLEVQIGEAKM